MPMPPQELSDIERENMIRKMRGIAKIIFAWAFIFAFVSLIWWLYYSEQYYADVMISLFIVIWFFTGALTILMVADDAI